MQYDYVSTISVVGLIKLYTSYVDHPFAGKSICISSSPGVIPILSLTEKLL